MKRIIFINAHWNHLLMNSAWNYFYKINPPQKYSKLFAELLKDENVEVLNYISKRGNIIPHTLNRFHFRIHSLLEAKFIFRKNGFGKKIKNITSLNEIKDSDTIIAFVHSRLGADDIQLMRGKKIVNLNQYQLHSYEKLNKVLPYADAFMLEADVFKDGNYIMSAQLPQSYQFCLIPYLVADRFKSTVPFSERNNKAVATGTIGICSNADYVRFYGTNLCHKMRKVIYDNQQELAPYIDSYISPYIENSKMKQIHGEMFGLKRYFNIIYNYYIGKVGKQTKYFSFNIVEKYNEYQMAVVPEEIVGIPAIGAFEAMACGCALIGIKHQMYDDLGLTPGKHYITYDGSCEDLKRTISYYQVHINELQKIAEQGCKFVNEHFRSKQILNRFITIVSNLALNNK